jgi:succinate dehydrogenase / fumarate reductase flavoprotein subunit
MQGLADGYFIIPYTIGGYFAGETLAPVPTDNEAFDEAVQAAEARTQKLMAIKGKHTGDSFARKLGQIMWSYCGMSRNQESLKKAADLVTGLRGEFGEDLLVPGSDKDYNKSLEKAGRIADRLEFAQVMIQDALTRAESCGCHFREEFQTEEGEAKRNDEEFCHVAVWEYAGEGKPPRFHKEPLVFENVVLTQRSYK